MEEFRDALPDPQKSEKGRRRNPMERTDLFLSPCSQWDRHEQERYQHQQADDKRERLREIDAKAGIQRTGTGPANPIIQLYPYSPAPLPVPPPHSAQARARDGHSFLAF
jgi:hypothetical protein